MQRAECAEGLAAIVSGSHLRKRAIDKGFAHARNDPMKLRIVLYEGARELGVIDFDGSREEAARAAEAALEADDVASQAQIYDDDGKLIATVHPRG